MAKGSPGAGGEVTIVGDFDGGKKRVYAEVILGGVLAVHKHEAFTLAQRPCWTVTHVPTGMAIVLIVYPKRRAVTLAKRLLPLLDWSKVRRGRKFKRLLPEQQERIKAAVEKALGYGWEPL